MATKETLRARAARMREEMRETGRLVLRAPALVRTAECAIRFLLGAVLAGAEIFGGYAPFGLGMVVASGSGLDGFAALLLGKYRAGSSASLVTVDREGREVASLDMEEQVLDMDAAGRYTAVLTAAALTLYTDDLRVYQALENTMGAQSVVLRSDGTAYLIGGETARLYIPE